MANATRAAAARIMRIISNSLVMWRQSFAAAADAGLVVDAPATVTASSAG
jgi:hypothetical protein